MENQRKDGRTEPNQIRPLAIVMERELGVLVQGKTKVHVTAKNTLSGGESQNQKPKCTVKVEESFTNKCNCASLSLAVRQALTSVLLPDEAASEIEVECKIVQSDGDPLPSIITAAAVTLAKMGVVMSDIPVAAAAAFLPNHPVYVDLTSEEEELMKQQDNSSKMTLAIGLNRQKICFLTASGPHVDTPELLDVCHAACRAVGEVVESELLS